MLHRSRFFRDCVMFCPTLSLVSNWNASFLEIIPSRLRPNTYKNNPRLHKPWVQLETKHKAIWSEEQDQNDFDSCSFFVTSVGWCKRLMHSKLFEVVAQILFWQTTWKQVFHAASGGSISTGIIKDLGQYFRFSVASKGVEQSTVLNWFFGQWRRSKKPPMRYCPMDNTKLLKHLQKILVHFLLLWFVNRTTFEIEMKRVGSPFLTNCWHDEIPVYFSYHQFTLYTYLRST